jgi:hypothetical protein
MISTNRKVGVNCMCYLGLTTIVKPLNVVWMSMKACRSANLCHEICTHQVVAPSSINDGAYMAVLDDEENLEEIVALKLL